MTPQSGQTTGCALATVDSDGLLGLWVTMAPPLGEVSIDIFAHPFRRGVIFRRRDPKLMQRLGFLAATELLNCHQNRRLLVVGRVQRDS